MLIPINRIENIDFYEYIIYNYYCQEDFAMNEKEPTVFPAWAGQPPVIAESEISETVAADIVVVGSGNAGVLAATAAAFAGASVSVIEQQTRDALHNVERVLFAAGCTKEDVVLCRVYIPDVAAWDTVNAVYAAFFGSHKPARVIVPTRELHNGALVEIEAVAELRNL